MSVLDFMKKSLRRATGKKASRTGLRRVGTSKSHDTCDLCGKTGLKETHVMEGADGTRVYYGSECAARRDVATRYSYSHDVKMTEISEARVALSRSLLSQLYGDESDRTKKVIEKISLLRAYTEAMEEFVVRDAVTGNELDENRVRDLMSRIDDEVRAIVKLLGLQPHARPGWS